MNHNQDHAGPPSDPDQAPPKTQDPQNLFAEWAKYPIIDKEIEESEDPSRAGGWFTRYIKPKSVVLMDDYLMILTNDEFNRKPYKNKAASAACYNHLLVVDLRDFSVQKARLNLKNEKDIWGTAMKKYNENKIIIFGGDCPKMITIESFQPLSWKWEDFDIEGEKKFSDDEAHINRDCLYSFDPNYEDLSWCYVQRKTSFHKLWRFELENKTWKTFEIVGENPGSKSGTSSFIFKDNLYNYGGNRKDPESNKYVPEKDIFRLNLDTMEWKKLQQQENFYSGRTRIELGGDIYKEHLVLFGETINSNRGPSRLHQLRCWNINTNSWEIFNVKDTRIYEHCDKLIVYKDLLLIVGEEKGKIRLATYNLMNLGLEGPISPEEEHLKSLFMNEEKSDIKFKVQDQIIPAHKDVLIEKSRFFAGLFKSGMAETNQDVIEINDCDFIVFREFLRFIYCNEININNEVLAFKLLDFSDKHLHNDLKERCIYYLQSNINMKTVLPIFEEAHARNLENLMTWCCNYLKKNLAVKDIAEIVQYLISKQDESLRDIKSIVIDWIMENYFKILQEQNQSLRLCEEFLIKNIQKETILRIFEFIHQEGWGSFRTDYTFFVLDRQKKEAKEVGEEEMVKSEIFQRCSPQQQKRQDDAKKEAKEVFEQETMKLRDAVYCYIKEIQEQVKIEENEEAKQGDFEENDVNNGERRGRKRNEPIQKDNEAAEKPELKKTKK